MGPQAKITFNQLVGAARKYYQNQVTQGIYREYWWCSKHIDAQERWSGVYIRHKEEQHDMDNDANKLCNEICGQGKY